MKSVGKKYAAKLANFWRLRSASEQRTLSLGGLILFAFIAYFGVYEPLRKTHARMVSQVHYQSDALKEIAALMEVRARRQGQPLQGQGLSGQVMPGQGMPGQFNSNLAAGSQATSSLTALVDQSIRAKNLQSGLKNIATVPPNKVRIELGGVNFDVLMALLEQLERESQVQVVELSIDTLGTSTVNAKVTLSR